MNLFKTLTISLLTISFAFAADDAAKLPGSVQVLLDKTEKDVAAARRQYDAATDKITQEAAKSIKAEMDKLTKAGKLDEAMAVKKLLEGLRETVVASAEGSIRQKGDLLGETGTRQVTIEATTEGLVIATAKKGQTIVLQYVSGTWGDGGSGKGSPDLEATVRTCRMQLVAPSSIVDVPTNTVKNAYKYKVTEDGEYSVRMVDTVRKDNTGSVVYTVTVK